MVKIVQVKKNSLEVLQISCHICNKVCQAQEIEKIPEREDKADLKTSDKKNTGNNDLITKNKKNHRKDAKITFNENSKSFIQIFTF